MRCFLYMVVHISLWWLVFSFDSTGELRSISINNLENASDVSLVSITMPDSINDMSVKSNAEMDNVTEASLTPNVIVNNTTNATVFIPMPIKRTITRFPRDLKLLPSSVKKVYEQHGYFRNDSVMPLANTSSVKDSNAQRLERTVSSIAESRSHSANDTFINQEEEETAQLGTLASRFGRGLNFFRSPTKRLFDSPDDYFESSPSLPQTQTFPSHNSNKEQLPTIPTSFAEFVSSNDNDAYIHQDDESHWYPYYIPSSKDDSLYHSATNTDWKTSKRDDNNYQLPPDYRDVFMMMNAIKRMEYNSSPKPGLLSRIVDNPTTLVMATFIPMSLILAAALPLLVNVMTKGIKIPPIIPSGKSGGSAYGKFIDGWKLLEQNLQNISSKYNEHPKSNTKSKTKRSDDGNLTDIWKVLQQNLQNIEDPPECLSKIMCKILLDINNSKSSGSKFLQQIAKFTTSVLNEELLNSLGFENFVQLTLNGNCNQLPCSTQNNKLYTVLDSGVKDWTLNHNSKVKSTADH